MKQFLIIFSLALFTLMSTLASYAQRTPEKLVRDGVALHDKGEYKAALECYQQALAQNPNMMPAIYEASLSYLSLNDYTNAIQYSTRVLDANFQPLMVDAYVVKSTALAQTNKVDQSIQLLNEALVRCGDEYLLYFNLGLSYFNKKENLLALSHLRKAIELEATRPSALLLYAYSLNDADRWIQSFYTFHFFLMLEPNTERSKDAFDEMYNILTDKRLDNSSELSLEEGVDRRSLYNAIQQIIPAANDDAAKYRFFRDASKKIFFTLGQMQNDTQNGLLWNFFVPTYDEILGSGHFDTYSRYVSVSYFDESLQWWNDNKDSVDNFIEWFDRGQVDNDEAEIGDDLDE